MLTVTRKLPVSQEAEDDLINRKLVMIFGIYQIDLKVIEYLILTLVKLYLLSSRF